MIDGTADIGKEKPTTEALRHGDTGIAEIARDRKAKPSPRRRGETPKIGKVSLKKERSSFLNSSAFPAACLD